MMSTLRPGTFVVVRSAKPLAIRDSGKRTTVAPSAAAPIVTYPDATVADSPAALPGTRSRASVAVSPIESAMPGPIHPEIGLREQENERQAP